MTSPALRAESATTFVGRRRELAVLTDALEQSLSGQGQVVTLVGEAGIGKTRTAQEFARMAALRGARVLWGKCFEEPGAPPFWPWLQILREFLRSSEEQLLRRIADLEISSIVELLPEFARWVPGIAAPPPLQDAAQARYRLFDAITLLWTRASVEQPLVIVLDNLHWADTASLRLLEFVAPELAGARVTILGTYRDTEVTRGHPLSNTLAEFARLTHYRRLGLVGLAPEDTVVYLASALGEQIDDDAVADIHARTEGLPLYLVETARYLMQSRVAPGPVSGARWRVPEGIRAIIGGRLNRLPADCITYLQHAAVMGRQFNARVMDAVLSSWTGTTTICLEAALSTHIVEALPEPNAYQFAHALLRETLYDEIPVPRRAGLHRQVGEAIEMVYAGDLDPHVSALVQHYQSALPDADPSRLASLALVAARQAEGLLAHEDAARYCRIVLSAWDAASHFDPMERSEVLLRLGQALERAGNGLEALRVVHQAFDIALSAKLPSILGEAIVRHDYIAHKLSFPGDPAVAMVQAALPHLRGIDHALRARVLSAWTRALVFMGRIDDANRVAEEAVAVARHAGDPIILVQTLVTTLFGYFLRGEHFEFRRQRTEEICALAERIGAVFLLIDAYDWRTCYAIEKGDRDFLKRSHQDFTQTAMAARMPMRIYMCACTGATLALMEGRFAEYQSLVSNAFELGRRLPGWDATSGYSVQMFNLYFVQGRLAELAPVFQRFMADGAGGKQWQPGVMMMHMALDQKEEARRVFNQLMPQVIDLPRDGTWATSIVYLAEVCAYLGDTVRAQTLYDQLSPFDGRNIVTAFYLTCHGPAGRLLGMLASQLGRFDLAERHFISALELAERQAARPAQARTELEFARLLWSRNGEGDAGYAFARANSALVAARELGMTGLQRDAEQLLAQTHERTGSQSFPAGLSRREVQVLRLIAEGRSNQEIADVLVRSPNTVANHVRNILAKVNAANRAEAATFAARHGLLDQ